jgi:hypothetical protein
MERELDGSAHERAASAPYRVGVVGHRELDNPDEVALSFRALLAEVLAEHPRAVLVTALATGADTICAGVARDLGLPIETVVPFEHYAEDFYSPNDQATYQQLLQAATVTRLPHIERSDEAYRAGGLWVLDHCDLLVAVWDGRRLPLLVGGTADMVAEAEVRGLPMHIIPAARSRDDPVPEQADEERAQNMSVDPFKQYRLIVEDTAKLSDRRQIVNNYHISANAILLGTIGILAQISKLDSFRTLLIVLAFAILGIILCRNWRKLIRNYKQLVGLRIALLEDMETDKFTHAVDVYLTEKRELYSPDAAAKRKAERRKRGFGFADTELQITYVFQYIYVIGMLLMTAATVVARYSDVVTWVAGIGIHLPH